MPVDCEVRDGGVGAPRYLFPFHARKLPVLRWPVVVVGGGCAGAAAALQAAAGGREVLVLKKPPAEESNTRWAQGGIAAAIGTDDSIESHAEDTLEVGCGLAEEAVVRFITARGPEVVHWLEAELGVPFDHRQHNGHPLTLEGGHRRSRVLSAGGDSTGKLIQARLDAAMEADARITVRGDLRAVDLLVAEGRCVGLLATGERSERALILGGTTVLATGAVGQIFRETTNPTVATGDGLAMAYRAGGALMDLEFVQFHPTTLYIAGAARVLISEAVRGAGAILVDREGRRVMEGKHERLDLAPRDVVSRAILDRMVETGDTHVYLDASRVDDVIRRFPQIASMCRAFGIDIASEPIPVRPGAHYMIGGVRTDLEARTNLPGLLACGEAAATGLHGANRLASNSLLEGVVMGRVAGQSAVQDALDPELNSLARLDDDPELGFGLEPRGEVQLNLDDMLYSLKAMMWRQVGLVREAFPLADAEEKIGFWERVLHSRVSTNGRLVDLANMLLVSRLVAAAALWREESRGTHYRLDHPERDDRGWRRRLVLQRELP